MMNQKEDLNLFLKEMIGATEDDYLAKDKKENKMSIVKMDSEDIAEIKNALCVIQLNAEVVEIIGLKGWRSVLYRLMLRLTRLRTLTKEIVKQVKRIDRLLPKVKFEGKK